MKNEIEYNVEKSIKAQEEYCIKNKLPHFAPFSGICYYCNKNIYEKDVRIEYKGQEFFSGIDVERAGSSLITGCPHCTHSYCD